ncbi:hypothetical protein [Pseudoalteromonas piscicida]|uniref:hypothetical protein n=1 Tax=Pseudoalteromonas piscicida TaxID=43662 RepID=UPI001C946293|nr:hypothetical protein [Pseudoalteromonas piscicida]QZO12624.1 hypothetical protein K5642_16315 [Pseudoalteromonas piscicida]
MNELLVATGHVIRGLEVILLVYLVLKFKSRSWSLFFGGKGSLKTPSDHEVHSCFISALCVLVFHFFSGSLAPYIVSIDGMEKLELRQFFYFSMLMSSVAFATALFFLHVIRGCKFSAVARYCLYITFAMMLLQTTQFVLRGMLDINSFSPVYKISVMILNVLSLMVVSMYPISKIAKLRAREV